MSFFYNKYAKGYNSISDNYITKNCLKFTFYGKLKFSFLKELSKNIIFLQNYNFWRYLHKIINLAK